MPVYVSPGVYTTILDLSLYIPNLSTTIAGFVGLASKGPLNEPQYISNVLSFVTTFGQPNPAFMGPYAALQFLRYGRQLYYTRVAGASAAAATADLYETTTQASVTSGIAGPYTVINADNNVLKVMLETGVAAQGTITVSGTPIANETFDIGAQTFTWKALRAVAGEVTIGATAADSVENIVAAVNTDIPLVATAKAGVGTTVVITSTVTGTLGNAVAFTEASTGVTVDGAGFLGGTTLGVDHPGVSAQGTITMSGAAIAGETFVIGAQTFTWAALRAVAGEVTIDPVPANAAVNIAFAINTDMTTVTATPVGSTVVVTSRTPGTAGNAIIFTEASTNMAMDGTGTLGGTFAGIDYYTITLTKGVQTAAAVAAEIQAALDAAALPGRAVVSVVNNKIQIKSAAIGAVSSSKVVIGSTGAGSSANATLGFTVAGMTSLGVDATNAQLYGSGVNSPFNFVTGSNDTLDITINGTTYSVTLTTGAPVPGGFTATAAQVAGDINAILGPNGRASVYMNGPNTVVKIVSSGAPGSADTLLVSGYAVSELGFDQNLHRGTDDTQGTVLGTKTGPFVLGANNLLKVRIDNAATVWPISLPLGSPAASDVVAAINAIIGPAPAAGVALASVTNDGKVKITSNTYGTTSAVRIEPAGSGQYAMNFSTAPVSGTGTVGNVTMTVNAAYMGTYGNTVSIRVSAGTTVPGSFKLTVYDGEAAVEAWDDLSKVSTDARFHETIINGNSTWITTVDDPTNLGVLGQPDPAVVTTLAGGNDGDSDDTDADYIGVVSPGQKTGLQAYANSEDIDLNIIACPGISSPAVINEMLLICSVRGDCMAIIDPPLGLNVQQVVDWHNGAVSYNDHQAFNSMYGALYWPWLEIYDAVNKQKVWVPPSGLVAGVYAYTDTTTETWFAPAGLNRGHLLQPLRLEYSPDLGERDLLYGNQNSVNPIVNFRRDGITIWGQRSLQRKPSALDRVNVVRLVLYLRKVIATAVKYLLFEPNDPVTWSQFVNLVEPYMESVKQRRGVVDYKVICDASTNPPDAIDRNEMHGVVALKPTKAVEFLEVKFAVVNQGARFEDLTF